MKRLSILVCVVVAATAACSGSRHDASPPDSWPTRGWRSSTPAEQGMDGTRLDAALASAEEQGLELHGVLVIRHGTIVMEKYFPPWDEGRTHQLYSCTKSFISALTGIAIDRGLIADTSAPVLGFFPGKSFAHTDARKSAMKVEDLLTMSSGLGWVEGDATYRQMYISPDWVRFVLDLPMTAAPGRRFNYNSGNSHLLSAILQRQTGMKTSDFARLYLFDPLGIREWFWEEDSSGLAIGGWGLRLTPREMAKLGYLYLHDGAWDGKQVVSASWVRTSTQKRIEADNHWSYGYQWWVDPTVPMFAALGRYGQCIFVVPRLDMVAVFTAHIDSNEREADLVRKYLVPACVK